MFSAGDDAVRPMALTEAIAAMAEDPGLLMFDNEWLFRRATISLSSPPSDARTVLPHCNYGLPSNIAALITSDCRLTQAHTSHPPTFRP